MARTVDIETGTEDEGGLLELTLLSPFETGCDERTALLTVRGGKDHVMNAEQLEKLGKACLRYAKLIRDNK